MKVWSGGRMDRRRWNLRWRSGPGCWCRLDCRCTKSHLRRRYLQSCRSRLQFQFEGAASVPWSEMHLPVEGCSVSLQKRKLQWSMFAGGFPTGIWPDRMNRGWQCSGWYLNGASGCCRIAVRARLHKIRWYIRWKCWKKHWPPPRKHLWSVKYYPAGKVFLWSLC